MNSIAFVQLQLVRRHNAHFHAHTCAINVWSNSKCGLLRYVVEDELREDWKVWDPSRALGRDGSEDQIQV